MLIQKGETHGAVTEMNGDFNFWGRHWKQQGKPTGRYDDEMRGRDCFDYDDDADYDDKDGYRKR